MSETVDKLLEAKFFLEKAEESYLENPEFDYFLSAFITSARSVLWVMRSEYSAAKGWDQWYQSLNPNEIEEKLLKNINAARIKAEKKAPLKTRLHVEFVVPKEYADEEVTEYFKKNVGKQYQFVIRELDDEEILDKGTQENEPISFVGKIGEAYRVLDELGGDNVLVECQKYYAAIKEVVDACENLFGDVVL